MGVQRRKSNGRHGSFPPVPGPLLDNFFVKKTNVSLRSVLLERVFVGCCFYRVLVRFLMDFRRPGTMKTLIIVQSGIKIKKNTNSVRSSPGSDFGSNFVSLLSLFGVTLADFCRKRRSRTRAQKKTEKKSCGEFPGSAENGVDWPLSNNC